MADVPCKVSGSKYFRFLGHTGSVTAAQLCRRSVEAVKMSASTLYVPGTTQGIRDTKMTQWSPPLIAKPVDVADKKAELRARGKRKTGR